MINFIRKTLKKLTENKIGKIFLITILYIFHGLGYVFYILGLKIKAIGHLFMLQINSFKEDIKEFTVWSKDF